MDKILGLSRFRNGFEKELGVGIKGQYETPLLWWKYSVSWLQILYLDSKYSVSWLCNLGTKISADGDWCHVIKRCLLLGRKAMANLDSVLKSRDISLPTNVHLVKAMFFPVVRYGCERWTTKKAECWRTDAFELWCWRRRLWFFLVPSWICYCGLLVNYGKGNGNPRTPVFLPGESQGRGSLVGCRLWDRTESDTTEVT